MNMVLNVIKNSVYGIVKIGEKNKKRHYRSIPSLGKYKIRLWTAILTSEVYNY